MMDDLTQAAHISIGLGVDIDAALVMVAAANHYAAAPAAPITVGNVVFGVDFSSGETSRRGRSNGLA